MATVECTATSSTTEDADMALLFRLGEFGRAFATRGRGKELRSELLVRAGDTAVVTVDFEGITNVSYSFADEFLGPLMAARDHDDTLAIKLVNMTAPVDRVVQSAMSRRRETPVAC
jgi:hypothetical protein